MKKVILASACLLLLSTAANAQEISQKPTPEKRSEHQKLTAEQRAQKHVDALNTDVSLTDAQKPKVYDLSLAKIKKADEIRAKYKGQPENKEVAKKEMQSVRQEFHKNLKAVLTPEQAEKLKAKNSERKASGQEGSIDHD